MAARLQLVELGVDGGLRQPARGRQVGVGGIGGVPVGYQARFFERKGKDTDGKERPMWRTRWTAPEGRCGGAPHPPVLLVFNRIGERNPTARSHACES
ncbi:hypothetical protein ACTFBT_00105 [Streptomyces microflavus]|uniref:hypothetical protein n=1 Tax=Streptomyces TaxID=1883 RepID=UPI0018FEB2F1|nr:MULTISPECIES: hypothetical protein [Streptomyces]MCX4657216.1 hypothetical protein [Streptomyces microflavus]MDX2982103.1 hypothetical protein [Streptomyces sp. NRRL_B-2249]WSS39153.1 hypothetical protein OG269_00925 [Streptomyces microflavus]WST20024.1 hypothetical protein OG721_37820 [Streptomyces microflavus]